jgi:hypothetical protein
MVWWKLAMQYFTLQCENKLMNHVCMVHEIIPYLGTRTMDSFLFGLNPTFWSPCQEIKWGHKPELSGIIVMV